MLPNTATKLLVITAWVAVALIAYATLAHVGFVYAIYHKLAPLLRHPEIKSYARFEHIIAFAVLGAVFCFAYPRRIILVCCIVFGAAALLEYLQTLTPDRHGTLIDAMEKIAGGAAGIILAKIALIVSQKRRDRAQPSYTDATPKRT